LSSAFLLFSASAIASLSDPSLKGIHRESTEGPSRTDTPAITTCRKTLRGGFRFVPCACRIAGKAYSPHA
jgi:hypothetical protein